MAEVDRVEIGTKRMKKTKNKMNKMRRGKKPKKNFGRNKEIE